VDDHGKLPLTELTFDRAAAPSPFGEDVTFPLPPEHLNFAHPEQDKH
jgi:succinate dehydrogenase / fumarate reductase iron-sulfur subunit